MTSPPPAIPVGASVSIDQIYGLALATHDTATRIETRQTEQGRQIGEQDRRIRSLEQWRLGLAGVNLMTVVGIVVELMQAKHG